MSPSVVLQLKNYTLAFNAIKCFNGKLGKLGSAKTTYTHRVKVRFWEKKTEMVLELQCRRRIRRTQIKQGFQEKSHSSASSTTS